MENSPVWLTILGYVLMAVIPIMGVLAIWGLGELVAILRTKVHSDRLKESLSRLEKGLGVSIDTMASDAQEKLKVALEDGKLTRSEVEEIWGELKDNLDDYSWGLVKSYTKPKDVVTILKRLLIK